MTKGGMESVEVFTSEGKGRGLKAQKEFLPGDVIFAEPAYAAVVFDSLTHVICHTCFKRQERLHRCGQCKFAYYCDRTCQRAAWLNHKNECSAIKKHGKAPSENIRLAARIMWKIEREGSGLAEGCLVSIDDLQNHVDNFGEEEKKELHADVESFLEFWPPQSQQFGMQYISHIFGVISCNGFTLSDQRGLQAVGVGIFPNLCQANHDCWPNCTVIFNNGNHEAVRSMFHTQMRYMITQKKSCQKKSCLPQKAFNAHGETFGFYATYAFGETFIGSHLKPLVFRWEPAGPPQVRLVAGMYIKHAVELSRRMIKAHAARGEGVPGLMYPTVVRRIELRGLSKISPGDELTVSYVDFLNVSEERRKQLKKQYYFDCACEHCKKQIKDDLMLAVKEGESKPSAETVKDVIQFSKDTLEKINKARMEGLYHEVVKLCRECLKKQEPVLGDTNIYLLRILSIASEVLSYLQMFEEAADYAKRMVDGYLKIYHPNNAQLGMAVMRAGVTHWHAGLIEAGHGLICKAYAILLITHGPSHPITKDLEVMRVQTEMELRMFQQNEFMYYKMREAALKNQKIQVMPEPSNETSPSLFHKKE